MCKHTEGRTRGGRGDIQRPERVVIFGTYSIWSGRNGGMESALHGLAQGQVDCVVMQETNLTDEVYTGVSSVFRVMAMAAPSAYHRGVTVF